MKKLVELLNTAHESVEDIRRHAEGLDPETLLEAVAADRNDLSEPVDADAFIAALRDEGLL